MLYMAIQYFAALSNYSTLQMKDKKFDFFPVNKAKCLEKKEEDETKKQLAELNEKVTLVLSRFEKQVHTMIHKISYNNYTMP